MKAAVTKLLLLLLLSVTPPFLQRWQVSVPILWTRAAQTISIATISACDAFRVRRKMS